LTGLKQASDLKSEQVLCKPDDSGEVIKWVCAGLGDEVEDYGANLTIGVYLGKKLIAGIILNDHRENHDVWLTIYSTDKRWCTKAVIKYVFGIVFILMNCRRCNVFISKDNHKSLSLCERLGFVKEGLLRQYRENGTDCYVLGMLKKECRWL
jgi:RimJ/RimL family protein N-acetyltransferase